MQKWEYKTLIITYTDNSVHSRNIVSIIDNNRDVSIRGGVSKLYDYLDDLGRDGWELVSQSTVDVFTFKRPIE